MNAFQVKLQVLKLRNSISYRMILDFGLWTEIFSPVQLVASLKDVLILQHPRTTITKHRQREQPEEAAFTDCQQ